MKEKIFVIDGHALCYRAYYAFIRNPLINSAGQNISAIFGFARMMFKLIQEQNPEYLVVAFDPPQRSFRWDLYAEYKANREKMPDDLKSQIEEIKNMVSVLGITKLEVEGYEADDILGTVAKSFGKDDKEVYLVTGDKDAYQLIDDNVKIYANKKGISDHELYSVDNIKDKIGIEPKQVVDYMAIMGDQSDNIPGVKGIGEKGALKLITAFGSLDGIYDGIEEVKGKQKEYLLNCKEMAYLSKDLVTIRTDVPLDVDLQEMKIPELFKQDARDYFINLEMKSIADDFLGTDTAVEVPDLKKERKYNTVTTEDELKKVIGAVKKAGYLSIDTETTSTSPVDALVIGVSMSIAENEGWYIPLVSKSLFGDDVLDREISLALMKTVIEDSSIKKIGQNIKYDLQILRNEGIEMAGIYFDTMIASYLINPNERRHNLDDLASKYLNYTTITYKELVGTGKKAIPLSEVPMEELSEYAIEDADITFRLYKIFSKMLKDQNLEDLFFNIEMKLVEVLADMEYTGVLLDGNHFVKIRTENEELLKKVEADIYSEAGQEFNINSTRDLAHILFEKLGLPHQKKTKTGYSTDISVLESLKGSHDIIEHLISYRTLSKLKNTYIDALPKLISPSTGKIHTSYNQTVAATGRLSSSDPNLQNIPVRTDLGKNIRKGFIPPKGCVMMSADYSQIELRLAAHLSGDANMLRAFQEGIDIHSMTASSVFATDIGEVTSDMRRQAKIINFATIYGVSPYGLSQQAEIGMKEAAEFIRLYFETYPGFKEYIDKTISFARENGYVQTLLGRKRAIAEITSDNNFRREGAERIAINTPIQGTSADMIKVAMIDIHEAMQKKGLKSRMIMQVHDELVFEVDKEEEKELEDIVREKMTNALDLNVPIIVDLNTGENWDEAH